MYGPSFGEKEKWPVYSELYGLFSLAYEFGRGTWSSGQTLRIGTAMLLGRRELISKVTNSVLFLSMLLPSRCKESNKIRCSPPFLRVLRMGCAHAKGMCRPVVLRTQTLWSDAN